MYSYEVYGLNIGGLQPSVSSLFLLFESILPVCVSTTVTEAQLTGRFYRPADNPLYMPVLS